MLTTRAATCSTKPPTFLPTVTKWDSIAYRIPWDDDALEMNCPPVSAAPSAPDCAECSPSGSKKNGCRPNTLTAPDARAASNSSAISVDGVIG